MQRGRPPKYDPKFIDSVDEYLATRQDEEYRLVKSEGGSSTSFENKIRVKLPTVEEFAMFIGVNKTTLYEWEKNHESFSNALDKIRLEQKKRLMNSGLSGDYNPVIAKLVLSANHGMADKKEIDHTTQGESINAFDKLSPEAREQMRLIYEKDMRKKLLESKE